MSGSPGENAIIGYEGDEMVELTILHAGER
jgi:hypothetical protein